MTAEPVPDVVVEPIRPEEADDVARRMPWRKPAATRSGRSASVEAAAST